MSKKSTQSAVEGIQDTPRLDSEGMDSLAAKLESKISGSPSDETELDSEYEFEDTSDFKGEELDAEGDEDQPDDADEELDEESVDEEEPEAADDESPTLSPAHLRTLKAYGWSDEEIDHALEAQGEKFIPTVERLHQNRNEELARFAEMSRQAKQQQQSPSASEQPSQHQQQQSAVPGVLERIDADKLKKEYGDDRLIDDLVTPLNKVVDQINSVLPHIKQGYETAQQSETQVLREKVDNFFNDRDIQTEAGPLYGKSGTTLTQEQTNYRDQVLQVADALAWGAQAQGRQVTVEQALRDAHDVVAGKHRDRLALEGLQRKAKQRRRGIVNKPSRRSSPQSSASKPTSREELEKKIDAKIAKLKSG